MWPEKPGRRTEINVDKELNVPAEFCRTTRAAVTSAMALLALAACQPQDEQAADAARADTAATTGAVGTSNPGASSATGTADAAFLTTMSDHHQGLIDMARNAEQKGTGDAKRDASRLRQEQDREQQQMLQHLSSTFQASHTPKTMPRHQAMTDSLSLLQGQNYNQTFYHHVVMHHQEGIAMIDSVMPTLGDSQVRSMAARMRQQQTKEIEDFQPKTGSHGGHQK